MLPAAGSVLYVVRERRGTSFPEALIYVMLEPKPYCRRTLQNLLYNRSSRLLAAALLDLSSQTSNRAAL